MKNLSYIYTVCMYVCIYVYNQRSEDNYRCLELLLDEGSQSVLEKSGNPMDSSSSSSSALLLSNNNELKSQ